MDEALNKAEALLESGRFSEAESAFSKLLSENPDCREAAEGKRMAGILDKNARYCLAREQMAKNTPEGYKKAAEAFHALTDWRDAGELATQCEEKEKKLRKRKKTRRIWGISLPAAAILGVALILINLFYVPAYKYDRAVSLIGEEDYTKAYRLLSGIDYKDSKALLSEIKPYYNKEILQNAKIGDTVIFGSFEQDNNKENGAEDVEWIVLDKDGDNLLLISKYILTCVAYYDAEDYTDWEGSYLRFYMNFYFKLQAAGGLFNEEEQKLLQNTFLSADENPQYDTDPGNYTTDEIFSLSVPEVEKYFPEQADRLCLATPYAISLGVRTAEEGNAESPGLWWLRTPGDGLANACAVNGEGTIVYGGYRTANKNCGVRPALWINPQIS